MPLDAAEKMRRLRARAKAGYRVHHLTLHHTTITELLVTEQQIGLDEIDDPQAVDAALIRLLDDIAALSKSGLFASVLAKLRG
jgi:hypothetical protein